MPPPASSTVSAVLACAVPVVLALEKDAPPGSGGPPCETGTAGRAGAGRR
ncbi:hypothetical protein ACFRAI_26235 [Streptomyces sp. NPDC056637]